MSKRRLLAGDILQLQDQLPSRHLEGSAVGGAGEARQHQAGQGKEMLVETREGEA